MSLAEALQKYLKAEIQGQLIIKFRGEEHLCKVSIDDGHAVYISLGKMGPEETLEVLAGKQVEWINFIEGMPSRKRVENPLNKRLMEAAEASPSKADQSKKTRAATQASSKDIDIRNGASTKVVESIIEDFIEIIGPLGTILAERAAQDLGYREGAAMAPETLKSFIEVLAGEIPENKRQTFLEKYIP